MNSTDVGVIVSYEHNKLGHNTAKAAHSINLAFKDSIVIINDRKVQRWFEKFRTGAFIHRIKNQKLNKLKYKILHPAYLLDVSPIDFCF